MTTTVLVGAPIEERSTRVTIRRILQYVLDLFVLALVLSVVGRLLGLAVPGWGFRVTGGSDLDVVATQGPGTPAIATLAVVVLWFVAFVLIPYRTDRTLLMMVFGLRIVRRDGGAPTFGQHLGRALLLIVDTLFGGLVGLIVMLCSRHRQRIGDHAAGTVVIRA